MRTIGLVALAAAALGCLGEPSYDITFPCGSQGGPGCPYGERCPTVPPDAPGCASPVPGIFGHAPLPYNGPVAPGCVVGLPYGNPYYGDSQQKCYCPVDVLRYPDAGPDAGSAPPPPTPIWECPV